MAFTGKAAYTAFAVEGVRDVAPNVAMISPRETPVLDWIGDGAEPARNIKHTWLEDAINTERDALNEVLDNSETAVDVDDGTKFLVNDQIRVVGSNEIMLVTGISTNTLTVTRGYGGSTATTHADNAVVIIQSGAAIDGADVGASRETTRTEQANYSQIFSAPVSVSGSKQAVTNVGVVDEKSYQENMRLIEKLRELQRAVITGEEHDSSPEGTSAIARTMNGIHHYISTHDLTAGSGDLSGLGTNLTLEVIKTVQRLVYEVSGVAPNGLAVGSLQKMRIDNILQTESRQRMNTEATVFDKVQFIDTDFGEMRVLLSRDVPPDAATFMTQSKIGVIPLGSRSFQVEELAKVGDSNRSQLIGEYTLEVANEACHARVGGLSTS